MITRPTGPAKANVMLIGEAPYLGESVAWSGRAGRLLDEILFRVGLERDLMYVTNLRTTPIADHKDAELYAEIDRLLDEIRDCGPTVIVAMGRGATRYFLGDVDMEAIHGVPHKVVIPPLGPERRLVLPVYNPAMGLQNTDAMAQVIDDFQTLAAILDGAPMPDRDDSAEVDYKKGFDWPVMFKGAPLVWDGTVIHMDTEGWADNPYCVTYSIEPRWSRMILATDKRGLNRLQKAMDQADKIVLHNCLHDIPVLAAMGLRVRDEQLEDTMVMAYNLQLEPQGLKPLALRYAGMQMGSYQDLTWAGDQELARYYVETALGEDWGKAEPQIYQDSKTGEWKVRQPRSLVSRMQSILTAYAKDPDTDIRKRWSAIEGREVVEDVLGPIPQLTLDMLPEADVLYYACRDADATGRVYPHLLAKIERKGLTETYRTDMSVIPMVAAMHKHGIKADPDHLRKMSDDLSVKLEESRAKIMAFNAGKWINPDSPDQVRDLIFGRLRLISRKRTKAGELSTQDKVLEALRAEHEAVGHICDFRELGTMKNDFADKLQRFIDKDGRVRCTFRITRVVSGRLSATNPNLMAIPVRGELGRMVRDGFVAEPGWKLGSIDLDQAEIKVFAALSNERRLIDAINAGADVHTQTAQLIFKTEKPTKEQRTVGKRCGFGVITGITGSGLYDQMRLAGITEFSVRDCDRIINEYFKAYPDGYRWLMSCRDEVYNQGYVADRIGRIRYLNGVWADEEWQIEEAKRQSHSHKIQATAQAYLKLGMAEVWSKIKDKEWIRPLLQVHDEMIFECREDKLAEAEAIIVPALTRNRWDWPLEMSASFTWGDRWGALKG